MRTSRTGRHIALLSMAALLAGCGGHARRTAPPQPKLPATVAERLATRSDAVAARLDAGDGCGALDEARGLQQQAIAAINARRVPAAFQESLLAATNDLVARITCVPAPPPTEEHRRRGEDKDKGHGKHGGEGH
jgi:hypothetical protein